MTSRWLWLLALAGLALHAADGPPAGWPGYLREFRLPAGRTWDQYRVRALDAMPQALIPAGEFLLGSPADDAEAGADERPQRRVTLAAFWLDLHPVTVAQYTSYSQATQRVVPKQPQRSAPDHPVVSVTWEEAVQYARWAGARLPSEAEYERAARGGTTTRYPWGPNWSSAHAHGEDEHGGVKPICRYPANALGLYDLMGNVCQWCADRYDSRWYERLPAANPVNTDKGEAHVLRGGSFFFPAKDLRVAVRGSGVPTCRSCHAGFRCAQPN